MTHDQLVTALLYLIVAVVAVLLIGLGRVGSRYVDAAVQRCVPEQFGFARRALSLILMFLFFAFIMILFFTVFGVVVGLVNPK